MKRMFASITILLMIISGCDNNVDPNNSRLSGEITLNTLVGNNKSSGFSFSQGNIIEFPNANNTIPDFIVMVQRDAPGNILGVFLGPAGNLKPTFNLINQFYNKDSAQVFFDNLNEVPENNYTDLAIPVKVYQVWSIKTNDNKFGKILILYTNAYRDDSNPNSLNDVGEVKFKWTYQQNGTPIF